MKKSITYGLQSLGGGEFDRRPVEANGYEKPEYKFGERGTRSKPSSSKDSIVYYKGKASGSSGNAAKQVKMQGATGGRGSGKNSFGKPKGSVSSFKGVSGAFAKQTKGFGGQTTRQY